MDPTIQRNLVRSHIASLEAEAAVERLARTARAIEPRPSVRTAVGRRLIAIGTAIVPVPREDPCQDTGAGQPA